MWLYFREKTDLFDGRPKQMLHIAPEPCLEERLRDRIGSGYLTADLLDPHAAVKMDIADIQYPPETFDVIYCSHVLEHVPDDKRAMRELYRVLKRNGWAVLLVPISADKTVEDPSITELAERQRVFGQEDHVRRYGPDYVDRLRAAGYIVEATPPRAFIGEKEIVRMGLTSAAGEIYYCQKG